MGTFDKRSADQQPSCGDTAEERRASFKAPLRLDVNNTGVLALCRVLSEGDSVNLRCSHALKQTSKSLEPSRIILLFDAHWNIIESDDPNESRISAAVDFRKLIVDNQLCNPLKRFQCDIDPSQDLSEKDSFDCKIIQMAAWDSMVSLFEFINPTRGEAAEVSDILLDRSSDPRSLNLQDVVRSSFALLSDDRAKWVLASLSADRRFRLKAYLPSDEFRQLKSDLKNYKPAGSNQQTQNNSMVLESFRHIAFRKLEHGELIKLATEKRSYQTIKRIFVAEDVSVQSEHSIVHFAAEIGCRAPDLFQKWANNVASLVRTSPEAVDLAESFQEALRTSLSPQLASRHYQSRPPFVELVMGNPFSQDSFVSDNSLNALVARAQNISSHEESNSLTMPSKQAAHDYLNSNGGDSSSIVKELIEKINLLPDGSEQALVSLVSALVRSYESETNIEERPSSLISALRINQVVAAKGLAHGFFAISPAARNRLLLDLSNDGDPKSDEAKVKSFLVALAEPGKAIMKIQLNLLKLYRDIIRDVSETIQQNSTPVAQIDTAAIEAAARMITLPSLLEDSDLTLISHAVELLATRTSPTLLGLRLGNIKNKPADHQSLLSRLEALKKKNAEGVDPLLKAVGIF
jgi:hypothetical protein